MTDADHAVRGGSDYTGQQPRPPGVQHLPPRPLAHLRAEQGRPVGHPARIAERGLPVSPDRAHPPREFLQPEHVVVKPRLHDLAVTVTRQGLGGHRAMVGQPALELRPGPVQSQVRLVQRARDGGCRRRIWIGGHVPILIVQADFKSSPAAGSRPRRRCQGGPDRAPARSASQLDRAHAGAGRTSRRGALGIVSARARPWHSLPRRSMHISMQISMRIYVRICLQIKTELIVSILIRYRQPDIPAGLSAVRKEKACSR